MASGKKKEAGVREARERYDPLMDVTRAKLNRRRRPQGIWQPALWSMHPHQQARAAAAEFQLFWGDLRNRNAVGTPRALSSAATTLRAAISIFSRSLRTPQWHDMPDMPNNAREKWVKGFSVLRDQWPKGQKLAESHNEAGKLVSFLAYEWHSSHFGDYASTTVTITSHFSTLATCGSFRSMHGRRPRRAPPRIQTEAGAAPTGLSRHDSQPGARNLFRAWIRKRLWTFTQSRLRILADCGHGSS
jgi:Protein of unknown function (DUF3604)